MHWVAIAIQRLRISGIFSSSLLVGSGITENKLRQSAELITRSQKLTEFSNALGLTKDEGLGLEIGAAMHLPSYGLLGYAMLVIATLRHSLNCALHFPILRGSYFQIKLETE